MREDVQKRWKEYLIIFLMWIQKNDYSQYVWF